MKRTCTRVVAVVHLVYVATFALSVGSAFSADSGHNTTWATSGRHAVRSEDETDLENDESKPQHTSKLKGIPSEVDYIVVGAGPGGCLAAKALAEHGNQDGRNNKILLVERGLPQEEVASTRSANTWPQVINDDEAVESFQFVSGVYGVVAKVEGGGTSVNGGLFIEESPEYFMKNFGVDNDGDIAIIYRGYAIAADLLAFPTQNSTLGNVYVEAVLEAGRGPLIDINGQNIPLDRALDNIDRDTENRRSRLKGEGSWLGYSTFGSSEKPDPVRNPASNLIKDLMEAGQIILATSTTVDSILWDSSGATPSAVGVVLSSTDGAGSPTEILAEKAVILSAGAVYTPYLLMKSGIGPKAELSRFPDDIVSRVYNEAVGANFVDRPVLNFAMLLESSESRPFVDSTSDTPYLCPKGNTLLDAEISCVPRFLGRAISSSPGSGLFYESVGGEDVVTQFAIATGALVAPQFRSQAIISALTYIFENIGLARYFADNSVAIFALQFSPTSRGTVTLPKHDLPNGMPVVDNNMFATGEDLQRQIVAARQVINTTLQPAWDGYRRSAIIPPSLLSTLLDSRRLSRRVCQHRRAVCLKRPGSARECRKELNVLCNNADELEKILEPAFATLRQTLVPNRNATVLGTIPNDSQTRLAVNSILLPPPPVYDNEDAWASWVKQFQSTSYHYFGTAASGSVVDPVNAFGVLGTEGLHVSDASVFPTATRVNPQATIMAMGYYIGTKIASLYG